MVATRTFFTKRPRGAVDAIPMTASGHASIALGALVALLPSLHQLHAIVVVLVLILVLPLPTCF